MRRIPSTVAILALVVAAAVAVTLSLLVGLLSFALYAVGVNVLPISPTVTVGLVLVFVVAGMGGFLGTQVLAPKLK